MIKPNISSSVLGASSNLLGICFVMLGYLKKSDLATSSFLDESLILPMAAFFAASFLAYLALRTDNATRAIRYERMADTCFILGLSIMIVIAMALTFQLLI